MKPRTRNVPSHKGAGPAGEGLIGFEARSISLVEAVWSLKLRSRYGTTGLVALIR